MNACKTKRIGVLGAGQMGSGIAQAASCSMFDVVLFDIEVSQLEIAKNAIEKSCAKLLKGGKISPEAAEQTRNIDFQDDFNHLRDCDLYIEAVKEDEQVKSNLFKKLGEFAPEHAIFASNTSSISINRLAAASRRPEHFIGMHFMNPVPLMKLVEIISGVDTTSEVQSEIQSVVERMGKTSTRSKDYPGFVINRILMPMINESFYALMEGVSSKEEIDIGMKLGTNQPMGPLQLADFIGLDTCLAILEVLYCGFSDSKYRPCPLLRNYVDAGWLGRKTKRGVYQY